MATCDHCNDTFHPSFFVVFQKNQKNNKKNTKKSKKQQKKHKKITKKIKKTTKKTTKKHIFINPYQSQILLLDYIYQYFQIFYNHNAL